MRKYLPEVCARCGETYTTFVCETCAAVITGKHLSSLTPPEQRMLRIQLEPRPRHDGR